MGTGMFFSALFQIFFLFFFSFLPSCVPFRIRNILFQCNQDELGNRKMVEQMVGNHLRDKKNVIVDRCNFDYAQRHTWVKLASQYGVKWWVIY
jgi:hypothetical protein